MNKNDPSNMTLAEINRTKGELANQLAYATEHHRRKNAKAGITRQHWKDSGCQFIMGFVEFRQQGVRNKIRRSLGLESYYLPWEDIPKTVH